MANGGDGQKSPGTKGKDADKSGQSRTIDLDPKDVKDETPAEAKAAAKAASDAKERGADASKGTAKSADTAKDKAASAAKATETAAPKATPSPPPPPAQKSGGGIMSAGIGGIIGAALVYGASYFGFLPAGNPNDDTAMAVTSLEQSVAGLRDEIAATPAASPDDLAALQAQVAELAAAQSEVPASVEGGGEIMAAIEALRADVDALSASGGGDNGALATRIDELAAQIEAGTATGATDVSGQIAALEARIEGISSVDVEGAADPALAQSVADLTSRVDALAAAEGAPADVDLSPVTARLDAVETQVASIAEAATGGSSEAIDSLSARIDAVESTLQVLPDVSAPIATLEAGIGDLTARLTELSAMVEGQAVDLTPVTEQITAVGATADEALSAATTVSEQVAALETQVGDLGGRIDAVAEEAAAVGEERQAATLVALSGLQRAAQGSGPFETELQALTALMGDDSELVTALSGFAGSGVPSMDDVEAGFADQTATIIQESAKAEADTVLSRLSAGAQSLVRIRPTGFVAGDSPAAKVARIEALLAEGKLAEAVAEWDTLDEPAKAATSDWANAARNRLALNAALAGGAAEAATN